MVGDPLELALREVVGVGGFAEAFEVGAGGAESCGCLLACEIGRERRAELGHRFLGRLVCLGEGAFGYPIGLVVLGLRGFVRLTGLL
ncbi:MAG: hypothetical protein JO100_15740 [Pseudonocardia sp.]|nr:hypothetical protein [Pseudonocardia sp.]